MSKLERLKRALAINEISKETMSSYMMKASDKNATDAVNLVKKGKKMSNNEFSDANNKILKRDKTIRKVISKLNQNEEVDSVHGYYAPHYDKFGNKKMGKFFKNKEEAEKHVAKFPHETDKIYPVNSKYEKIQEENNVDDAKHHYTDYKLWKQHAEDNKYKLTHGAWDSYARDKKGKSVGMFDGKRNIGHLIKK